MDRHIILCGTANPGLGQAVAREMGLPLAKSQVERFPDGEISAEVETSIRERQVFLIQPTSPPVNDHLLELVALADACRRAAAERVIAVVPYFGYARADRRKGRRVPIMGRAVADILESCGINHLVTIDLHSPQLEGFFHVPVENLTAVPTLVEALRDRITPETVIVSPDLGAAERASTFAEALGCSVAVLPKRRLSGREVEIRMLIGDVEGRPCVIVDDMISTGGTILKAIEALQQAGAQGDLRVVATHGVFSDGAPDRIVASGVTELVVTDTVAARPGEPSGVDRVSIAPFLASALRRVATGESLTELFLNPKTLGATGARGVA